MSFVIFEGDIIPSKVEVAGTEPNLLTPLISLIFQTTIGQLVSDLDQIDSNLPIQTTPLPYIIYRTPVSIFSLCFQIHQ